jgi:hypothetical protein
VKIEKILEKILELVNQESFGGRAAPVVSVSDDTYADGDGVLHGLLEVKIAKRDGDAVVLQQQSLEGIDSEVALKDLLSEVLSKVLSNHSKWPR